MRHQEFLRNLGQLSAAAVTAVGHAGEVLKQLRFTVKDQVTKSDGSPVSRADTQAEAAVLECLDAFGIPVVSEERADLALGCDTYWLVDPLDGTKEFLVGEPSFSVNIALILNQEPVLGAVAIPSANLIYFGSSGTGAWREFHGTRERIDVLPRRWPVRIGTSRSHKSTATDAFCTLNEIAQVEELGSAWKYCLVAEGVLDIAPRFVGSSEWDTAAAHAILLSVGGDMIDLETKRSLAYGKEARRNGGFIAIRKGYALQDFCFPEVGG